MTEMCSGREGTASSHCFHSTGMALTSNPPKNEKVCCFCGHKIYETLMPLSVDQFVHGRYAATQAKEMVEHMLGPSRLSSRSQSERARRAAEQARQILDEGRDPREVPTDSDLLDALRELLREVAVSGVEDDDKRLDYVTVQIDRVTWEQLEAIRSAMNGGKDD